MGAKVETLCGLTGIGDLIVTCESRHSRNRKAGMLIGQGVYHEAGYRRSENGRRGNLFGQGSTCSGKKYDVELPIIEEVNKKYCSMTNRQRKV